jgi:exoribonuclease-2
LNGANGFSIPKPDIRVENNKVTLGIVKEGMSKRLVQEFMIIANEIASKFAHVNDIPIPHKGTIGERTIKRDEEMDLFDRILSEHYLPTCITQIPSLHSGLGVFGYTQVTSPIRRGIDLLIHYQLKAFMRGNEFPMNWEQIQMTCLEMEPRNKQISNLQKTCEMYWICKYFEKKQNVWKGLVLDCKVWNYALDEYRVEVYLVDNAIKTRVIAKKEYQPKEEVEVRVKTVVPQESILEFEMME